MQSRVISVKYQILFVVLYIGDTHCADRFQSYRYKIPFIKAGPSYFYILFLY